MVKDSKRYAATGGWGFEEFRGDSQTDRMIGADAATKCYACHTSQKERDFVFSSYRKYSRPVEIRGSSKGEGDATTYSSHSCCNSNHGVVVSGSTGGRRQSRLGAKL